MSFSSSFSFLLPIFFVWFSYLGFFFFFSLRSNKGKYFSYHFSFPLFVKPNKEKYLLALEMLSHLLSLPFPWVRNVQNKFLYESIIQILASIRKFWKMHNTECEKGEIFTGQICSNGARSHWEPHLQSSCKIVVYKEWKFTKIRGTSGGFVLEILGQRQEGSISYVQSMYNVG